MITLQDCLNLISLRKLNPKDVRLWVCKEREDNNSGLEKTFSDVCHKVILDKDNDLRIYLK